ncbi:MAG: hypothetical protein D6798_18035 [Deltaproteobacteria bacterium]|nr:MAG: hypothetical protein D6798_18035 [Deltaproteobacteria bacterium]
MPLLLLLTMTARAGGLHAGIPVDQATDFVDIRFEDADQGWSAALVDADGAPAGFLRVYVGPTQAAAARWMEDAIRSVQAPLSPQAGLGDVAVGDPDSLVICRDGNVALMVRAQGSLRAEDEVRDLLDRIVDEPLVWPAAARVVERDGLWFFEADDAVFAQVTGGRRPLGEPNGYIELPSRVVTWDRLGRAAVLLPQR